jgi:DUF4097 and DUF4098 domain-containing protein YvlB
LAYQEVKNLSLSAEGIERLEIDCGAGFLVVSGQEGLERINAEAEIILEGRSEKNAQKFIRERVKLSLERQGNRAVLISQMKERFSVFSFRKKLINLKVYVPTNIDLGVDDGSGWLKVDNIRGKVVIEDGSGEMMAEDITGVLRIDDGSGDMEVVNIRGDVDIDDGSGSIDVEGVVGSVSVDDGSGSMTIHDVEEDVTVSDSSGSINIDGVEGNVTITDDGSGSVKISNVKGKVSR